MKTYSMDLSVRVFTSCDAADGTREQIAARFCVSVSWIRDLLKRRRETGSLAPQSRGGGRAAFDQAAMARLCEAVKSDNDATLQELATAAEVTCGVSTLYRALVRLGIMRTKKSRRAIEQDCPRLKAEREEFAAIDPSRLVFVDKTGSRRAMDRTHGRAASGSMARCLMAIGRSSP